MQSPQISPFIPKLSYSLDPEFSSLDPRELQDSDEDADSESEPEAVTPAAATRSKEKSPFAKFASVISESYWVEPAVDVDERGNAIGTAAQFARDYALDIKQSLVWEFQKNTGYVKNDPRVQPHVFNHLANNFFVLSDQNG